MGMFDYLCLKRRKDFPPGLPVDGWQTKNGPCEFGIYTVDRRGRLWFESERVSNARCMLNGALTFYNSGRSGEWLEFCALFRKGKLISVVNNAER